MGSFPNRIFFSGGWGDGGNRLKIRRNAKRARSFFEKIFEGNILNFLLEKCVCIGWRFYFGTLVIRKCWSLMG